MRRVALLALGVVLLSSVSTSVAHADDLAEARAEASAAARRVESLQGRIERAQQAYATALAEVGQRVILGVAAESGRQDAARAAERARSAIGSSARALYISGGRSALYASALAATDSHDLALRLSIAARVMSGVREDAARAHRTAQAAAEAAQEATAGADAAIMTADRIEARAGELQALLDRAQGELDRLSERARRLQEARDAQLALAAARAAAAGAVGRAVGAVQAQLPPDAYFDLYRAAAPTCPGMSWTLLAAVGQVESGHGRDNGPSSAGAVGPMQFMPRTFAAYAVDGDHDGVVSPWSPADAVFTAARYLCVNGGGSQATVRQALFAYNHATWYVDLVLGVQARIAAVHA